jgi:hypothetical protein
LWRHWILDTNRGKFIPAIRAGILAGGSGKNESVAEVRIEKSRTCIPFRFSEQPARLLSVSVGVALPTLRNAATVNDLWERLLRIDQVNRSRELLQRQLSVTRVHKHHCTLSRIKGTSGLVHAHGNPH